MINLPRSAAVAAVATAATSSITPSIVSTSRFIHRFGRSFSSFSTSAIHLKSAPSSLPASSQFVRRSFSPSYSRLFLASLLAASITAVGLSQTDFRIAKAEEGDKDKTADQPEDEDEDADEFDLINLEKSIPPHLRPRRLFESSPPYLHPTIPHLTIATASNLAELLDDKTLNNQLRTQTVLLELYSPDCGACNTMKPVIHQVALALNAACEPERKKWKKEQVQRRLKQMLDVIENEPETEEDKASISSISSATSASSADDFSYYRPSFAVAIMDTDANFKPGFLTEEEEMYLPLLKLFPAPTPASSSFGSSSSSSASVHIEPLTYKGPGNAKSIVDWIYRSLPPSAQSSFSLPLAYDSIRSTSSSTQTAVLQAHHNRISTELSSHPSSKVLDGQPCGDYIKEFMTLQLTRGYKSVFDDKEEEEVDKQVEACMRNFRECSDKKEKEIEKYWEDIYETAASQMNQIKERKEEMAAPKTESSNEKGKK